MLSPLLGKRADILTIVHLNIDVQQEYVIYSQAAMVLALSLNDAGKHIKPIWFGFSYVKSRNDIFYVPFTLRGANVNMRHFVKLNLIIK